ncbi:MAG: pyridoxal-phosphate dependent enzyme [Anaerolineaceae bacterium]|nr:pyridoxal-phosphate dependent enzyme [Anaerolineaceae bacterium]
MQVICEHCKTVRELDPRVWRCECGEAWEPLDDVPFSEQKIKPEKYGLWRYGEIFNLGFNEPKVSLGAGWTPLVAAHANGLKVHFKAEYISPTGSFKDRGTEVEINVLANQDVETVVDDSSGNAGSALAAYAASAGLKADIYVPHYASESKKKQIAIYGATVNSIPGVRNDAKMAAMNSVGGRKVYASHAYHPAFLLGQESVAWEVWEQLGHRAPDWYIVPVGQGVHLLGAWMGFERLRKAGLIEKCPKMVGVQPKLLNPIVKAIQSGSEGVEEAVPTEPSLAEGLAIAKPVRWRRILEAIRSSGGTALDVDEEEIVEGQNQLARLGLYAEPSSAVVWAALMKIRSKASPKDLFLLPLTGSGLKGAPKIH